MCAGAVAQWLRVKDVPSVWQGCSGFGHSLSSPYYLMTGDKKNAPGKLAKTEKDPVNKSQGKAKKKCHKDKAHDKLNVLPCPV